MMKHIAITLAAGSLLVAGNAWAEGCMYRYSQEAKLAATQMDEDVQHLAAAPSDTTPLMLWKLRGLDDAKRSRLLDKTPIQPIVPVHN